MCIAKQSDYGFIQISTGIFLLFLLILFNAKNIGLPQLMDQNRSRIYLTYMLTVLYALVLDLPAGIVLYSCKKPRAANGISLILSGIICAAACMVFPIRSHILAPRVSVLETNGAITCLGQILSERRNTTFTVVSANDELQMLAGRGQHYETITFLRYLKYAAQGQRIIIPTKYVYFYIEKFLWIIPFPMRTAVSPYPAQALQRHFLPVPVSILIKGKTAGLSCPKCITGRSSLKSCSHRI